MSTGKSTFKFEQPDNLFKGNWQNKSPPSSQSAMEIKGFNETQEIKKINIKEIKNMNKMNEIKSPSSSQSAMEIKGFNEIKEIKEFKQIKAIKVILELHF